MAVLCLLPNTPWPWPTPAEAASARGGFPTRNAMEGAARRSAQVQRGRLGCLLCAPNQRSVAREKFIARRVCPLAPIVPCGLDHLQRPTAARIESSARPHAHILCATQSNNRILRVVVKPMPKVPCDGLDRTVSKTMKGSLQESQRSFEAAEGLND
jgi:hypothetical protein